jgi:hypothetical protein
MSLRLVVEELLCRIACLSWLKPLGETVSDRASTSNGGTGRLSGLSSVVYGSKSDVGEGVQGSNKDDYYCQLGEITAGNGIPSTCSIHESRAARHLVASSCLVGTLSKQ